MKSLMIGTSWKMNKPLSEAMAYCEALATHLPPVMHPSIQPFFIPPVYRYPTGKRLLSHAYVAVPDRCAKYASARSRCVDRRISASMIAETGATLVEMGHSERRGAFNETDAAINAKVHTALRHGLRPLVCIGDSADENAGVSPLKP